MLRRRIRALDEELGNLLDKHEVGKLLTTIATHRWRRVAVYTVAKHRKPFVPILT
ncbi:MAG TPA: hypothetical protein VFL36_18390 [Myxococcales bacterium]|nr:hypothetical protein [Myxococcales bacterium]